ncbi:MAG: PAS domain S-box protein [Desulfobacteraceae bacterium]|nr:PAS domain S-box protein [Desulfobacteraceae bacterium]
MADSSFRVMDAMDALDTGIYVVNENFSVEYMNKYMTDLFGDGIGKKCYEVINKSDEPCPWCKNAMVFKKNESWSYEIFVESIGQNFSVVDHPVSNKDGSRSKLSIYKDMSRELAQKARLKFSDDNYKRLCTQLGCGVFTSSKYGRFLDVNPALLQILGYDNKEEFLALDLARDVYLNSDDRKHYMETIEEKDGVVDYEVEWKRKDGSIVDILLTSNVRYDANGQTLGYEGIIVDQTQRKNIEKQLIKAHDFMDKIISCSPNAIMAMDLRGKIMLWNRGAEESFGYMASDVVGKMSIQQVYSREIAKKVMEMIRGNDFGGKGRLNSYPLKFEKGSGEVVDGNLSASLLYDENNNEIATVAAFVDLNERLKMERQLGEARQHLLQSEKLAAMGRLTSQIAHELNNPLFGIMNTLELMKTEISPQNKRRKLLDMSLSEIMRLADMLKKMLSFSKPDEEEKSQIDINTVLGELLMLYEKRLRENSIKLKVSMADDPGVILASKDQLRQVFINLFSNAMYAMPDGGTLMIATSMNGSDLQITVSDTGTGIESEHIGKIFDSFFTTKTDSVKGVGLGLSVCYGFIQDHDGDISVESKVGEGTTFLIRLPLLK